ncbi:reverse transcriptase [Gossypium australe]|uniref:Reverse transcriptase n=1 Tax=Gossypium australe TaxID=47621 RepID=A0A5B6VKR7_9ROSI|nr:reverse transcriptase [Gossypium australe]
MEAGFADLSLNDDEEAVLQIQTDPDLIKEVEEFNLFGDAIGKLRGKILGIRWLKLRERNQELYKITGSTGYPSPPQKEEERHSDSFCALKMELGVEVREMGWDLSLRAQSRRAQAMNSVWLRNDGEATRATNATDSYTRIARGGGVRKPGLTDPVLGFNPEGKITSQRIEKESVMKDQTQTAMDHDLEDEVVVGEEGKKRTRGDVEEHTNLESRHRIRGTETYQLSVAAKRYKMEKVRQRCGYQYGIDVEAMGSRGGLSLAWRGDVNIALQSFSHRHIDVIVEEEDGGKKWRLTGFYGSPYASDREDAWNRLKRLHNQGEYPWIVCGDFNEILYNFEKKGGLPRDEKKMEEFRQVLEECQLADLGYSGNWFTWERGNLPKTNIQERLDRGVGNEEWRSLFPDFIVHHLPHSFSDHCPILINTENNVRKQQRENFRFEAWWVLEKTFIEEVKMSWGTSAGDLLNKLATLKKDLTRWAHQIRRNRNLKKNILTAKLAKLLEADRDDENLAEIIDTKQAILRKKRNLIQKLQFDDGRETMKSEEMMEIARSYFVRLFSEGNQSSTDRIFSGINACITEEDNAKLKAKFTTEEIWTALTEMGPTKAPGEDGLPAIFYQKCWSIIGKDVSHYCLQQLNNGMNVSSINKTNIVLIPKVSNPSNISQFRPISLCNVIYKLIAKVIANRLGVVIHKCIDPAQSAFVPGRLITDNVLLAYEILHTLKNKKAGKKGLMAVKLDMSKAYDRVEWNFVEKEDGGLGFRNLANFNVALLAKQGWRLINYPDSLLVKVLKAKYYPNSNFAAARLGNLPSLTWRSVWAGKGLLEKGMCWRVGKGDKISIWDDLWISGKKADRVLNHISNEDIKLVSDLIDADNRSWKSELIRNTFERDTAEKILQIPLAELAHEDLQVWRGELTGEFSVRSAYKLLQESSQDPNGINLQTETKNFYRKLWNLEIPKNIQITIWRISLNLIPSLKNLKIKRVVTDDLCPRCHQAEEDGCHIFQQCTATKEIWNQLQLNWVIRSNDSNMWNWLTWIFEKGCNEQIRLVCCGLWFIWFSRNSLVYEKKLLTGAEIVRKITRYIKEMDAVRVEYKIPQEAESHLQTPSNGRATIQFDAAYDARSLKSATGLLVRDEKGDILASKAIIHPNIASPFTAEAYAGLQAAKLGVMLKLNRILIMGDSKSIIKKCKSRNIDKSVIGAIIRDIHNQSRKYQEVEFAFIPNTQNQYVHTIAKHALRNNENYYLVGSLHDRVHQELNPQLQKN